MKIRVKLFAQFRKNRFKEKEIEVSEDTSVSDILKLLEIDEKEAGIIFVNGRHFENKPVLENGDQVSIFPVVGGG
ncbi:MAG: MoaD/ThiS family protein [Desulfobacteraceae bacterium]|nr:MoaD/ThiS family protein [Desulfobacteraceae bacterium]MCB9494693.1 MoaD/ThiS family protein [Desulfobacteraceae bacterium]